MLADALLRADRPCNGVVQAAQRDEDHDKEQHARMAYKYCSLNRMFLQILRIAAA